MCKNMLDVIKCLVSVRLFFSFYVFFGVRKKKKNCKVYGNEVSILFAFEKCTSEILFFFLMYIIAEKHKYKTPAIF